MGFPEIIHCLTIIAAIFVSLSILFHEKGAGISPTPSLPFVRRDVIGLIERHAATNGAFRVGELGCGWGGLAVLINRRFASASVTGFEISPCPLLVSRLRALFRPRLDIRKDDFMDQDWSPYDVLVCYLSPQHMERIEQKIAGMVKRPLVISCSFAMTGRVADETCTRGAFLPIPIYAYRGDGATPAGAAPAGAAPVRAAPVEATPV